MSEPEPPRTGARIGPLPLDAIGAAERAALGQAFSPEVVDALVGSGDGARDLPNALATMLHHPGLAGPWLAYNNVLLWQPALTDRQRELLVLRVAARTRSEYEWVQHVLLRERFAITDADVDAIVRGIEADGWTDLERALVAAADELLDDTRISDATWSVLAGHLDERELLEALFVVGTYACLAMVFNATGVEVEATADTAAVPPLPA